MGTATRLLVFVIATAVLVGSPIARAAEEVDLLLVLSSDVSRSVDARKFKLQRDGYAAAIVNPRVIQAIRSGALGKIAISFVEWSGIGQQKIVIDWTVIRDEATAKDFSAPDHQGTARLRGPNLDQRRHRFCHRATCPRAVPRQPPLPCSCLTAARPNHKTPCRRTGSSPFISPAMKLMPLVLFQEQESDAVSPGRGGRRAELPSQILGSPRSQDWD